MPRTPPHMRDLAEICERRAAENIAAGDIEVGAPIPSQE